MSRRLQSDLDDIADMVNRQCDDHTYRLIQDSRRRQAFHRVVNIAVDKIREDRLREN